MDPELDFVTLEKIGDVTKLIITPTTETTEGNYFFKIT